LTLKRAEQSCLFDLLRVLAGFFRTKQGVNFLEKIRQFLQELGGSLGHFNEAQQFPPIR
jgi:hypothetical protein